ncbi:cell wall protein PRY3-like isoform X2 [Belonocnema kinseyi]|uniref:cell wall protein PRY3-like isoform X2 n=1 Tax=Belonocnema kinseyi TaxID=2817044 RepID=UPI00143D6AE9|nr:cell wall protein PRY3-like isoform X2 [Belonocnema kinseyi]
MWWFKVLMFLPCWVIAPNYFEVCQDHTMCKYKGIGPTCGSNQESGVSKAEIQQILKLHNDFRAKIASGMEHRGCPGPQPSAANMLELIWDDNMAAVAQKWADQCMFQHDACRDDPRFQVGQNMYFSSGFSKVDWTRAVTSWYEEVARFNFRLVDSFKFQPTVGHYTQVIWGNTRYIGCGRVTYGGAYRLKGYQRIEYVLSSSPRNDSLINTEDRNRRGIDVRPDIDDIPTTVLYSIEDMEEQASNPSMTTQPSKENSPKQSTIESFTEKVIKITSEIEDEQTTQLCTTSEALEENNSSETTAESSTEKVTTMTFGIKEEKSTKAYATNQASEGNRSGETLAETSTEKLIQTTADTEELENPTSINQALENRSSETATETSAVKVTMITFEIKEEKSTKVYTTNQASEENSSGETLTETSTEKLIQTTADTHILETPTSTNQALENRSSETSTETSTEKITPISSEIKEEKSSKAYTTNEASEETRYDETLTEISTEKGIQTTSDTEEFETPIPTNQALENRSSKTATRTSIEEVILTTSEIKEEEPTTPSITTQALEEKNSRETTTDNSIENIGHLASENQQTPKITNYLSQNPKFSIFIPGYWISNSERDSKGQLAGSFQSIDFSAPGDFNSFIKDAPSGGALKMASSDHLLGRWNFRPNLQPTKAAENPARIQVNKLTQAGWMRSTYDNLGRDQILVCNYGPAGNYLYQPIYVRGKPCSRCPLGSVCRNGLCA